MPTIVIAKRVIGIAVQDGTIAFLARGMNSLREMARLISFREFHHTTFLRRFRHDPHRSE